MNLDKLKDPFSPDEIEWRVQQSGVKNGKPWAMVLAYVTSRAVMDRLDEVFGIMGWKDSYIPGADGGVICKLSVWDNEKKEWITKEDGSENTNIDAVKGGISGALKRAAVKFGIGRYLYNIEASFAIFSDAGKHSYIIYPTRDDQKRKTNGNFYKWDAPSLPSWALPSGYKKPDEDPKPEAKNLEAEKANCKKKALDLKEAMTSDEYEATKKKLAQLKTLEDCKVFIAYIEKLKDEITERDAAIPFEATKQGDLY